MGFFQLSAQKISSPKDSINTYYNRLFSYLKSSYIYKKDIDWNKLKTETDQALIKYDNFESSLNEIETLFNKIGANHCQISYNNRWFGVKISNPYEQLGAQWNKKYATKPAFDVSVIKDSIGYILMPAMSSNDRSIESIQKIAQPLYNQIAKIKSTNKIKGWIIDLRFNTGGDCQPMLLALYDFLGDNKIWGTLNVRKKQVDGVSLKRGIYYYNSEKVSYINPTGELLNNKKVSLIIGPLTASSGEVVALSFKGRPNTMFIGEKSAGYTTSNVVLPMPFTSMMALTVGYDCDRNGEYYDKITPDVFISKQDNFDDLTLDKNIQEAINYITH